MSDFTVILREAKDAFKVVEAEIGQDAVLADTMYLLAFQLIILKELGRMTHILENIEADMSYNSIGVTKP